MELWEKVLALAVKIPKSYYAPIALFMAGLIFLSTGLIQLFHSNTASNSDVFPEEASPVATQSAATGIQVDVEGAVVNPGVYRLPQNARVQDALIAAGGFSALADRDLVAKTLNLATKLQDGVKIYVQKIGETQGIGSGSPAGSGTVLGVTAGLININTASADQLDSLPGVGPASVQKIINARPFTTIDDLVTKKVVTQTVFQKIKDRITAF